LLNTACSVPLDAVRSINSDSFRSMDFYFLPFFPFDSPAMITFTVFLLSSLILSFAPELFVLSLAHPLRWPPTDDINPLCRITQLRFLCPRSPSTPIAAITTVTTPLGIAYGLVDPSGVVRYTAKYGSAQRWATSSVVTSWESPYVSTQ
jgi:hypothetical protein